MTSSLQENRDLATDAAREQRGQGLGLAAAVQFLTILPPLLRRSFTSAELGRSVGWFSLVGALIGGLLAALDWLLAWAFPPLVTAALLLMIWVLVTGALHLDGF